MGVAESLSPTGPLTSAVPIEGADGDAIDPAVPVDDDGQVYSTGDSSIATGFVNPSRFSTMDADRYRFSTSGKC